MRREYDFSQGTRGKHAGKRLRIVGDKRPPSSQHAATKMAKHLVGTAGEYYVCAELCRMGYLALLTPKNNPLFDVVATTVDGTASVSIQVKTRSVDNTQGWKLGNQINPTDTPGVPFIVLVNLHDDKLPDFYVYRYFEFASRVSEVFEHYITKPKRTGEPRKDPGFRWFDEVNFSDADRARMNNWQPIIHALEGQPLAR
jgi:hypothetical protein